MFNWICSGCYDWFTLKNNEDTDGRYIRRNDQHNGKDVYKRNKPSVLYAYWNGAQWAFAHTVGSMVSFLLVKKVYSQLFCQQSIKGAIFEHKTFNSGQIRKLQLRTILRIIFIEFCSFSLQISCMLMELVLMKDLSGRWMTMACLSKTRLLEQEVFNPCAEI